jgi:hypothetical protein
MRFSWTGLILAPLLVPAMLSAALASSFQGDRPVLVFLLLTGPGVHRVLRHHDIPLPALPVSTLFVATNDELQGLPAGTGAGRGGVRAADVVRLEKQRLRFWPTDRELLGVLRALAADPLTAIYPLAGLITAALYWWLGTWRRGRSISAPE